ncbi:MAG: ABC-type transport system, involved in lipoprotein release, permease component [Acidimicrobiales bacterium]|nr:ABC-type transport system, involved in lipoprotein release, permease component [Acidimicrobiales bacterium]
MFRTTLKNLAARKLRLLTTSLAVLLGVAFMAGTLVLTDTIGSSFDKLFADANAGTSVLVRGEAAFSSDMGDQRGRIDASLVGTIEGLPGVAAATPSVEAYAQLVDRDGKPIGNPGMGAPTLGGIWSQDRQLSPFALDSGRPPVGDHEMVIDKGSATKAGFRIGERASVLTKAGTQRARIVGIATFAGADSPGGASYTLFTAHAAQAYLTEPGKVDAIRVAAASGVSDADLADQIRAVVPHRTDVLTGAQVTAEDQQSIKDGLAFFNTFLLVFAVIALFVGSFIIYNSFSILVAQRSKENALMRALGASRRQVLGSVLMEAVAVGLVASLAGLLAGVGVASGLKSLLGAMGIDMPGGSTVLTTRTVVVSIIAGLGVSVASAVFPARKAAKVPPIAAMRDVAIDTSADGLKRPVIGIAVTGLGAAAMATGMFGGGGIAPVGLGAVLVFLGVAILGPVLARPISRVLGAPLPRLKGTPGLLARENATRNPKRTSATAAALMIGVALVAFITILASSTKASVARSVDRSFTGDLVVDSGAQGAGAGGLNPSFAAKLAKLPELGAVSAIRTTPAQVGGTGTMVTAGDPETLQQILDFGVTQGSLDHLGRHQIGIADLVAKEKGWKVGDTVPVRFAENGVQQFTIGATYEAAEQGGEYFVGLATYEANVADQFDTKVFVDRAPGVDLATARQAVDRAAHDYPQADVQDRAEFKQAQTGEIDMILNLIYALLGLAVFIALLGIANTLALSIFERTRELGLLRAVGMTRTQLRTTVRYEAVIISLLGAVLGLAIGAGFGWSIVRAMSGEGLDTFSLPVTQLGVMVAIAAVAGVAAAILPARRASRMNVLEAITAD